MAQIAAIIRTLQNIMRSDGGWAVGGDYAAYPLWANTFTGTVRVWQDDNVTHAGAFDHVGGNKYEMTFVEPTPVLVIVAALRAAKNFEDTKSYKVG